MERRDPTAVFGYLLLFNRNQRNILATKLILGPTLMIKKIHVELSGHVERRDLTAVVGYLLLFNRNERNNSARKLFLAPTLMVKKNSCLTLWSRGEAGSHSSFPIFITFQPK